ncbi:MAG: acyclic terpene utilization AtuA family protein, partial [Burkholderiales bacterium]
MPEELRVVAVNGMLGYGYELKSLEAAVAAKPHLMGCDAGSTDPGPYYLGSGRSLVRDDQIYRDLKPALVSACRNKIPFVLGSAGFAGAKPNLELTLDVVRRICREENLHFRLAVIRSDVDKTIVVDALARGDIEPMPGAPRLTREQIEQSAHVVGQIGTEPYIAAFEHGADVVIAGRSCDTAIYAALPIARGYDPGLALHMAKIMECGAQCGIPLAPNDCLMGTMRKDHFLVRPLADYRVCTPESVAAHTMYEQANPFLLYEPEGVVDIREAEFTQADRQSVRVSGSRYTPAQTLKIKLEGARRIGARAFTIAGARDRHVFANLNVIEQTVSEAVRRNLNAHAVEAGYQLHFRYYGRDGVLGELEPSARAPAEVGILIEA